jgi:hypothetical protein
LLATFHNSFPPASEREARMEDPRRRCETTLTAKRTLRGPRSQAGASFLRTQVNDSQFYTFPGNSAIHRFLSTSLDGGGSSCPPVPPSPSAWPCAYSQTRHMHLPPGVPHQPSLAPSRQLRASLAFCVGLFEPGRREEPRLESCAYLRIAPPQVRPARRA